MVYICVICMATQAPLCTLNNEHRKLLGVIVSPAVRPEDWERLSNTVLLACWECTKLVQSVAGFQGTALAGVNHLLSLLPAVEATQDAAVLPQKEEAADPLALLEIDSYIKMQLETDTKPLTQVDVKLESEPGAAASDSKPTAAELKTEDNTLNTEVFSETTSVDAGQNTQNSSQQATPVTSCDSKTATFTHGPVRVTPRDNVVYGSMLRNNPGHGSVPSGNVVCGPSPTSYVQNYQTSQVTSPMSQVERPQGPVASQSHAAHYQMYNQVNQHMWPSQLPPVTAPMGYNLMSPAQLSALNGHPYPQPTTQIERPQGFVPNQSNASHYQMYNQVNQHMWPSQLPLVSAPMGYQLVSPAQLTALNGHPYPQPTLPRLVPFTPHPANQAHVASAPYMLNATTGPNKQMNQLKRNLATSANRNGTKLTRRAQATGATSVPGGSMSIDVDAGNGQTDQQEIPQQKTGPWYVHFLSEAEVLAEREAARSAPDFAEALYMCDACLVVFNSCDDKDAHDSSVHTCSVGGYSCGICGYSTNSPKELRAHASRHSTRFCCSHCQFRTPDESVIRQHYCSNMPQQKKPRDRKKRIRRPPGEHKCTECAGRFQHEHQLQAHIERLHSTPSGPITCEICKKELRNKYRFYVHMYRHKKQEQRNLGPRPDLFCTECVKEFESKAALKEHMNTLKHSTKENWRFECDICKKKFPTKQRVGIHIIKIHVNPQRYKCDECPKDYSSDKVLRRHKVLSHAPPSDNPAAADRRPHVCHLCAKAFTVQKSLREHLLMHEGKRPFACPLCPATFTYSAALYTHNRLKHLKIKRNRKKKATSEKTKKAAAKSTD